MSFQLLEIVRQLVLTTLNRTDLSSDYRSALTALESAIRACQKFL